MSFFKNPHTKIDLLPRGQNPLSYYEYEHNIIALVGKAKNKPSNAISSWEGYIHFYVK